MNFSHLQSGEESFDRFAVRTLHEWRALARYIVRRMDPKGADVDDVTQELISECWRFIPKWDPARGSLGQYCRFNAVSEVSRRVKRRRARARAIAAAVADPAWKSIECRALAASHGDVELQLVMAALLEDCRGDRIRRAALGAVVAEVMDPETSARRRVQKALGCGRERAIGIVKEARSALRVAFA